MRKKGGAGADPRWQYRVEPAPGELRIVQALINTGDQREELPSPRAMADWLAHWDLPAPGSELGPADVEQVVSVRGWLAILVRANRGPAAPPEVIESLDRAAAAAPIRARFAVDGSARFAPAVEGVGGALGRLFEIVALANRDNRWRRLQLCAREDCDAAFYDFSAARSAKWCSARCGGRGSAETYRKRRKRYKEKVRKSRLSAR